MGENCDTKDMLVNVGQENDGNKNQYEYALYLVHLELYVKENM